MIHRQMYTFYLKSLLLLNHLTTPMTTPTRTSPFHIQRGRNTALYGPVRIPSALRPIKIVNKSKIQ